MTKEWYGTDGDIYELAPITPRGKLCTWSGCDKAATHDLNVKTPYGSSYVDQLCTTHAEDFGAQAAL